MFETMFGKHIFGARVAFGILATALLLRIGLAGFQSGQWLAVHLR